MRNWYTLGLTLYFIINNIFSVIAQQSVDLQWSANKSRYLIDVAPGKTFVKVSGLSPGSRYSVISNARNKNAPIRFTWEILSDLTQQQDSMIAQRLFILPDSQCVELLLNTFDEGKEALASVPVILSIRRIDEGKPPETAPAPIDQPEMVNLSTTGSVAASTLISNVLIGGNCFDVSNVTSSGPANSRGTFTNGSSNIGIDNGMVLCTGNVNVLPGPNNTEGTAPLPLSMTNNDADLAPLASGPLYDLTKIEFDFRPTSPMVSFDFVFGSEEYCEYVDFGFNDVFGFFISGPGIGGNQNIAVIPSTSTPVSIDNVSDVTNSGFFIGNSASCGGFSNAAECQLDGWTSVFTATANVIPCQTYHIKLVIADVGDDDYHSAVFLRANSFDAGGFVKANAVYPGGLSFVYEDCGQGFIRFVRGSSDLSQPLDVNFLISGTATPGVDYAPLVGPYVIPAGQASIQIPINVFADLIAEGNETIVLTLDNPCACSQTQMIFNIQDLLPMTVTLNDINACGSASTVLSPSVSGGQAPLTYAWSNGASSPTLNVNAQGLNTYTVTVTDACGRTSSSSAMVNLSPAPTAALSGSGVFCDGSGGTVNLNLNLGGPGDWTVTWLANGVSNTATFTSSPAVITATQGGVYSLVSVVSENGCTGTVSGNVNLQTVNVNLSLAPTNPTCFGLNNGSISATPSGGTAPYTYNWSPGGAGANPNNLSPGTYMVTVTSNQGCTEVASVTLTEPPQLTASATSPGAIDCDMPNGTIDLTVGGGTPNYTYTWSNGSSAQDPNVTAGGTYTVTVRDARNCTATASVAVVANLTQPTAVISPPGALNCNVTSLQLNATGSSQGAEYQYQWSGPGITCCSNTLQPQINAGGLYTLTVTNTLNGCTRTVSANIPNNNNPPAANATAPFNIGCNHPTVTLSGAGSATGAGISYQWSTTNGNIQSGATLLNAVANQAGTYTLLVTNGNTGCTAQASVTISGNTQVPTAVIAPAGLIDCYNPVLQLNASGSSQGSPFTYNWTGGTIASGGNTLTPSVSAGGTYTLVVTNPTNSCTATASVTVAANLIQPNASASAPNGINCQNATVTLNGTGSSTGSNFSYQWLTANGNITSGANTLNPVVNQGGTYTLVVTNNTNGCTRQVSVNVTQDQSVPLANAGPDRVLNCLIPSLQLSGSGTTGPGYTYVWSANPGGFTAGQNTLNPTVNQPGTYTLTISNNSTGCTSSDIVIVTSNFSVPIAQIIPPGVITCEFPTIVLDAGNSSVGPTIDYTWTGIAGGQIIGSNDNQTAIAGSAGTYRLLVTNEASGCTAQAQISVTQNVVVPTAEAGPTVNLTCLNPTASLNGAGSSIGSSYDYQWTTSNGNIVSGAQGLIPVVNQPGLYTLVVTNVVNGCTAQDVVNVSISQSLPVADGGSDLERTCSVSLLTINGNTSSAGPGIQYLWTANPGNIVSGATTRTPQVNQAGVYTLLVTNVNTGCTDTDVVIVSNNIVNPVPAVWPPDQITCYEPNIILDATGSTQVGSPVYQWATTNGNIVGGSNSATPQVNEPGIYNLTITNSENACSATTQVTVNQNVTLPNAATLTSPVLSCQNTQVQLSGQGSSIGSLYDYLWTTTDGNIVSGSTSLIPRVDEAGLYTLTVLNIVNGCTSTASVQVQSNQEYPIVNTGPPQVLTCALDEVILDAGASSQGSVYAYVWDSPDGNIISGENTLQATVDMPGTYNLNIVNQDNGCTATASVVVGTDYVAPLAVVAPGGILSCTVSSIALNGAGSSTGSPYTYNWTSPNGNIISGENTLQPLINAVGTYTLAVANSNNGCTSIATTSVQADASLPIANAGVPDTLTCTVNAVMLNATASSQGADYTYNWAGPGDIATVTSLQHPVTEPGAYFLTVTNTSNGCTAISTVVIVQDIATPVAEAGPANELTCTQTVIDLDGSGSSAGPLYQYTWTASNGGQIISGANTPVPTIDEPGLYQLLVTNTFNSCFATDEVSISQDIEGPIVEAGPSSTLTCVIPSIVLDGQGSADPLFAYTWTTTDGNIASGDTTLNPVVDAPGLYNVLVTNTYNGCTSTDNVFILRDVNVPDAVAEVTGELNCVTSFLQLNGLNSSQGPTLIYTWETLNGHIISGDSTATPLIDEPGQYTLEVYNTANSCVALSTVTVSQNLLAPEADAGAPAVISCANPVLTLNGTESSTGSQYTYLWNTQDGNITQSDTVLQPQIDQSGYYTLIVTDQTNGCTAESTVQILLDVNTPEADAGISPTLTCDVVNLNLNGTSSSQGAQFLYQWSTLDGQILDGDTTLTPNISAPGTYSLVVSNINNGCTSDAEVVVNQDIESPSAAAGYESVLNCVVLSTSLNVTGSSIGADYSYQWTTQEGLILSGNNTPVPNVGEPGVYNLLVRNLLTGCTNTASVTVPEDLTPPASASTVSGELTCAIQSLPLSSAGSSTGVEFAYLWSTTDGNIVSATTGISPEVDQPGMYHLMVTNTTNGCTSASSVAVQQNVTPPIVSTEVNSVLTCAVTQIQLQGNAMGGTQGITYAWTGQGIVSGGNTPSPTIDATGQYTLTATDLYNGCAASDAVVVSSDVTPPTIAIAAPAQLNCYVTQTNLNGAGSSTGGQFTYLWSGPGIVLGQNTLAPTVNEPGGYNLIITNTSNGCVSSLSTNVSEDIQTPQAQAGGAFELTCSVTTGTLNASGSATGNGINYAWSTSSGHIISGGNTPAPIVDEPGIYVLTVINAQTGCTSTANVAVTENTNYPAALGLSRILPKCGGQPGEVVIESVSGGVGPYLYSIDGGENFVTANAFEELAPGTYEVVVQDLNGCEYEESLVLPVPVEPQVSLNPEISLIYGQDAKLTAALNIPLNLVDTIIWTPMESLTLTPKINEVIARPFKDTEYTVRVINIDGCEDVAKVLVRVQDPQIWAPNIFSPHRQDGNSDYFLIFSADRTINKINTLQIYDRWGTMVFRRDDMLPNDETLGWDGRFRGKALNPAVFVWWADVELADGRRILLKGDVTIAD